MLLIRQLQRIAASSILVLLAACGGGEATTPVGIAAPSWASPAVFIPDGKESTSIGLQGCEIYDYAIDPPSKSLYQASININSAGDVSFVASSSETGTVTTYVEIKSAEANAFGWQVSGNLETPAYSMSVEKFSRSGYKVIGFGLGFDSSYIYVSNSNMLNVSGCQMRNTPSLQITPNQARAAKFLGTQSGINTYDPYVIQEGRIEAGNAYFSFLASGGGFSNLPPEPLTNVRFSLKTGELGSNTSSSAVTATYAPIDLSIPATSLVGTGSYGEQFCRNNYYFDFKDAKLLSLRKINPDQTSLWISVAAYDNKFMPSSSYTSCSMLF